MNELRDLTTGRVDAVASAQTSTEERKAFGGPLGATAMMVLLPLLTVYLWACVHLRGGALAVPDAELLAKLPLPTAKSVLWTVGWLGFQLALDLYLPGRAYTGFPQRDGRRLVYRLNGLLSLVVTLLVLGGLVLAGLVHGSAVLEQLGSLLVTAILFAYLLSAFLYVYGRRYRPEGPGNEPEVRLVMQADGSAAASVSSAVSADKLVYDYFMGTALNPRVGRLDLKMFFESKIGMTTWMVLTLLMAHADYESDGKISLGMGLVCLFQLLYVVDFYWFEEAMLSTWDINNENYGFMLAFGFVVWMPFTFSLQSQYLVYNVPDLSVLAAVGLSLLNVAGYYVFRTANLQKHRFKSDPGAKIWGRAPEFIQTRRGTKLLASGWWGLARHANYFGDLTMALAWCLACGVSHIVPFFYFLYFTPLLIDRERRDDQHCARKYGDDWTAYSKRVPHRIVPFLY